MAVTLIGTVNTNKSLGTTNTVSISSTNSFPYVSGDFGLIICGFSSTTSGTPGVVSPTVTSIASLYANDTADVNVNASWFFFSNSDPITFTYRLQGSSLFASPFLLMLFRGVDPTTPLDVTPTTATGINTQNLNSPAITPVSGNTTIISTGIVADSDIGAISSYPTGYTPILSTAWSGDTADAMMTASFKKLSGGAGVSEDPSNITTTFNTTTASWAAYTIALRPATGRVKYATGNTTTSANYNQFLRKPVKYWNGSSWVTKPAKYWNGSSWIITPW